MQPLPVFPDDAPLLLAREGRIAVLTLNQPARRNPLSEAMLTGLQTHLQIMAQDETLHAVILAAHGPVFCAGHDLKEMTAHRSDSDRGRAYFTATLQLCADVMQAITALPQPVIAAVEGTATAAGCQLVASCDLAIASQSAQFCTPGVHIGLFCSTPMVALSRNLSRKHAMEMLLTGDMVSADDALAMGLVNRVVPAGTALAAAYDLAGRIAAKSRGTIRIGKRAFYEQAEMPLAAAYAHASSVMAENMLSRDAEEGIGAFLEKRQPGWQDR